LFAQRPFQHLQPNLGSNSETFFVMSSHLSHWFLSFCRFLSRTAASTFTVLTNLSNQLPRLS
jgi:hypothetical protein